MGGARVMVVDFQLARLVRDRAVDSLRGMANSIAHRHDAQIRRRRIPM